VEISNKSFDFKAPQNTDIIDENKSA
ncbi:outer membrane lipoprotein carrier protein LolA, partial [Francisella tularensis subsp. holarctica]|nr:outer membrane lipoprotein carrier protein LolA [Francisella tularensis subsp. holarctica]